MKQRNYRREFIVQISIAIVISVVILNFVMSPVVVRGQSMEPTIHNGSYGISNRFAKGKIDRFDIVTADADGKLLIKRVIGLPGEKIEYRENRLYVNDVYIKESFLSSDVTTEDFSYEVPEGSYFLMGDNRSVSIDSRSYGEFAAEDIVACGVYIIFPVNKLGKVK